MKPFAALQRPFASLLVLDIDVYRLPWYYIHKRDGARLLPGRGHLQQSELRNAASLLGSGGGYLFNSIPSRIAAIISISNAMVSFALIGFTSSLSPEDGPVSLACLHDSTYSLSAPISFFDFAGLHSFDHEILRKMSANFGFSFISLLAIYTAGAGGER